MNAAAALVSTLSSTKCKRFNGPFLQPVDVEALKLHDYYKIVPRPMDLRTVREKMTHRQYATADKLYADLRLIWTNCCRFNPPGDAIHEMGKAFQSYCEKKYAAWPKDELYRGPKVDAIDLTKLSPKCKDPVAPRLQAAFEAVWWLASDENSHCNRPFLEPVATAVVPDYYDVIKNPMNLDSILRKIDYRQYSTEMEIFADLQLICDNCVAYNRAGDPVHSAGIEFKKLFQCAFERLPEDQREPALSSTKAKGERGNVDVKMMESALEKTSSKKKEIRRTPVVHHHFQTDEERLLREMENKLAEIGSMKIALLKERARLLEIKNEREKARESKKHVPTPTPSTNRVQKVLGECVANRVAENSESRTTNRSTLARSAEEETRPKKKEQTRSTATPKTAAESNSAERKDIIQKKKPEEKIADDQPPRVKKTKTASVPPANDEVAPRPCLWTREEVKSLLDELSQLDYVRLDPILRLIIDREHLEGMTPSTFDVDFSTIRSETLTEIYNMLHGRVETKTQQQPKKVRAKPQVSKKIFQSHHSVVSTSAPPPRLRLSSGSSSGSSSSSSSSSSGSDSSDDDDSSSSSAANVNSVPRIQSSIELAKSIGSTLEKTARPL